MFILFSAQSFPQKKKDWAKFHCNKCNKLGEQKGIAELYALILYLLYLYLAYPLVRNRM